MIHYLLKQNEGLLENNSASAVSIRECSAETEETLDALKNVLLNEPGLNYRLVYYALKNIRVYFASGYINGLTAQDVVQIVIEKIITGMRKWNKQHIPDIKALMFAAIKSFIRNEARRKKKCITLTLDKHKYEVNAASLNQYFSEVHRQDLQDDIFATDFQLVIAKLRYRLKKDLIAAFVLEELIEGTDSNIGISKNLKISVREVENAKKRIRNKATQILNKRG